MKFVYPQIFCPIRMCVPNEINFYISENFHEWFIMFVLWINNWRMTLIIISLLRRNHRNQWWGCRLLKILGVVILVILQFHIVQTKRNQWWGSKSSKVFLEFFDWNSEWILLKKFFWKVSCYINHGINNSMNTHLRIGNEVHTICIPRINDSHIRFCYDRIWDFF